MHPYRIFTLAEANRAVPGVATLTTRAQGRIEEVRREYRDDEPETPERLQDEMRSILSGWQDAVLKLGGEPKGLFTVDFRSPDPNVLWCWTAGESEISHRHFTWESFKDRCSLGKGERTWPSLN
jgi:hypothetical protein